METEPAHDEHDAFEQVRPPQEVVHRHPREEHEQGEASQRTAEEQAEGDDARPSSEMLRLGMMAGSSGPTEMITTPLTNIA